MTPWRPQVDRSSVTAFLTTIKKIVRFRFPVIRNDTELSLFPWTRQSLLSCCPALLLTGKTERKRWRQRYWSLFAPTKEQWTPRIWCLISIPQMCRRSFLTETRLFRVVLMGSRRWWPGPDWDCAEPKTVRGDAGGSTCVKTSSSADTVTILSWGKNVCLKQASHVWPQLTC